MGSRSSPLLPWVCFSLQLSAIDVSARTTMKGAANCDKHCELQNSVNQQILERKLHFRDIPESMPASVSNHLLPATRTASSLLWFLVGLLCLCVLGVSCSLVHVSLDTSNAWEVLPAAHSESSIRALSCCVALEFVALSLQLSNGSLFGVFQHQRDDRF